MSDLEPLRNTDNRPVLRLDREAHKAVARHVAIGSVNDDLLHLWANAKNVIPQLKERAANEIERRRQEIQ